VYIVGTGIEIYSDSSFTSISLFSIPPCLLGCINVYMAIFVFLCHVPPFISYGAIHVPTVKQANKDPSPSGFIVGEGFFLE